MTAEVAQAFPCFGSHCAVLVTGADARAAVAGARRRLERWHARFSRFEPGSELSRLNADPRHEVPVSATLARLLEVVVEAGERTDGLVDATLLREIEHAGYRADLGPSLPLTLALRLAPPRRPARPSAAAGWRALEVDRARGLVRRPPGLAVDSGGLAKGLFADLVAERLAGHAAFAVDCGGDLRFGGAPRTVQVADPFGGPPRHQFTLAACAVATSGISRRSWLERGRPAHHLLDPATGAPAFTGVVQATALAPTAVEAELRAKAAVLSGPDGADAWLPDGGVVVFDDGSDRVLPASSQLTFTTPEASPPMVGSDPTTRRT